MNNAYEYTGRLLSLILMGDTSMINESYKLLPSIALDILSTPYTESDNALVLNILNYSNILYNNLHIDRLPLHDDIYDRLVEYAFANNIEFNIGAPEIYLNYEDDSITSTNKELVHPMILIEDNSLYKHSMGNGYIKYDKSHTYIQPMKIEDIGLERFTRRVYDTPHMYPNLVGTLRKSKAVLMKDVPEEFINDKTYRVLERDFFGEHLKQGIITPTTRFTVVLELKYDGVSVEADTNSIIMSARTRGDTSAGVTTDVSNLFYGRPFPQLYYYNIPDNERVGVKFEAIMTKDNLKKYSDLKGMQYKNCRSAIVGLISSGEGELYKDLITLVPLAIDTGTKLNRLEEMNVINSLYVNEFTPQYVSITGDYTYILFCINRFLQEMNILRTTLPFMYDGIVVSYVDDDIVERLERKNFVNYHQEAVKFPALQQEATFLGYSYTIGQDGKITPMIHYTPVMFMGTTHTKSSGHSYGRFHDLNLRVGDDILVEYVNDVMPYVYKMDTEKYNKEEPVKFIDKCFMCGSTLEVSSSGRSIRCPNIHCIGVKKARMVNMLDKLNVKDFGDSRVEDLDIDSFKDLMTISPERVKAVFPTEVMYNKVFEAIQMLKENQIMDYNIVGALGFTGMAESSWKSVLSIMTIRELIDNKNLYDTLINIPGIGKGKVEVIMNELEIYLEDLEYISNMSNVKNMRDVQSTSYKIRYTGVRDAEFTSYLKSKLHDAGEGSVTKDTDILIIPTADYSSSKVDKAKEYGITIMTLEEAKSKL